MVAGPHGTASPRAFPIPEHAGFEPASRRSNYEYAKTTIRFHAGCSCSRDGCHQRLRWFEPAQWNHCHADLQPRRRSRQRRADGDYQHDHGERDDLLHSGWNATQDICHGNDQEVRGAHSHQRSDDHQGRRDGVRVQSINGRVGGLHDFDGAMAATPSFNPPAGAVASGTTVAISTTTPNATIYYTTNGTAPGPSSMRVHGADCDHGGRHDQGHRRGVRVCEFRRRVSGLHAGSTPGRRHADVQPRGGSGRRRNHGHHQHDDARRDDLLHHRRNGPRNIVDAVQRAHPDHGGRHDQGHRHRVRVCEFRRRVSGLHRDSNPDRRHPDVQPRGGRGRCRNHGRHQHDDPGRDDLLHDRRNGPRNVVDAVRRADCDHGGRHVQGHRRRVRVCEFRRRVGGLYPDGTPDRRHPDVQPRGGSGRCGKHGHDQHDHGRRVDLLHHRRNGPRNVVDAVHRADCDHGGRHDQGHRRSVRVYEFRRRVSGLYPDSDPDRRHADVQPRGGRGPSRNHGHDQHDDDRARRSHYTTDGTAPGPTKTAYTAPIAITAAVTIRAIATASGFADSAVGLAAYTILAPAATPTFNPAAGAVLSGTMVAISTTTAGATIRYTTDGTDPGPSSTQYTTPIVITAAVTIKAVGHGAGIHQLRRGIGRVHDPGSGGDADVQSGGGSCPLWDHGHHQHDDGRRDDPLHHRRNGPRTVVDGVHRAHPDHGGRPRSRPSPPRRGSPARPSDRRRTRSWLRPPHRRSVPSREPSSLEPR